MTLSKNALSIDWVVHGVTGDEASGWSSSLASNRYRAIFPAQALIGLGHRVRFIDAASWQGPDRQSPADVVVIGKLLPGSNTAHYAAARDAVLRHVKTSQAAGIGVLADFNDDHFDSSVSGPYWRSLANSVDVCVVGSARMAERMQSVTSRPTQVVGDPVASPLGRPKVFRAPGAVARWARTLLQPQGSSVRLKLVWYGSQTNWNAIQAWAEAIAPLARDQRFILWVVTRELDAIDAYVRGFNQRFGPDALMELVPWDEASQWAVVADADAVLIPSMPSDVKKAVKTGNRLTDALHAGRHVIASPLPSYQPYGPFVTLTEDPLQALRQYLARPDEVLARVVKGQEYVREQSSGEQTALAWLRAFELARHVERGDRESGQQTPARHSTDAHVAQAPAPFSASPVRLNLGCGDKILPGYVNVDVVAARAGKSPDVMCDLRELTPFVSDYADEILSVHVVEHFWRWEVEAVLKEWVRVLKPGGKLILECPNLQAACEAFLADPDRGSLPGKEGQTTMWVFYGDPRWKDPLMVHRWGYTPASLGRLLASIGLVDVRQEPAQYKMREPRDMRVVGFKPEAPRPVDGATVSGEARLGNDESAEDGKPADDEVRELAALQAAELSIKQRDIAAADALLSPFAAQSTNPGILVRLAKIRLVQGAHEAALELLKRAEQHHPRDLKVWGALAESFKLQHRYSEEMAYRRKLAYDDTGATVEAYTELVLAMINVAARGEEVSLSDVQFASKKVEQMAEDDPAQRLAFAETLYRIRGLESEARDHYSAASPCSSEQHDVCARWVGLRQWMEAPGLPLHRLSTAGRPGQRPMVAELEDVGVFPGFQWIPLLDEGRVAIDGFQVRRMRLRSEQEDAPILMNSATHCELRLPSELRSIETPAVLIGGVPQYYHHSIDHVSRLATLDALGLGADLPLVVNDDLLPFQLEHLALLGYPPERLIRVKAGEPVRFRRLLVPTPLVQGGKWMDPMIPAWYRSRLVPARTGRVQRRLYLSRGSAPRRQILNEEELTRMLVSEGYEVVRPETLTVAEQVALFSEASHIVSPSGAALTNMIYAPPGAAIVSMYSRYLHTGAGELYFDALAEACGHRFSVVMGDVTTLRGVERVGDADIVMDVEAVRAALH